ncbi:MAG: hypothetical protein IT330_12150 [Anaerolineae bacterium]|nr:hypothetical protein [Anaerolineae bacterium]
MRKVLDWQDDFYWAQEHHRDLLREAASERLARQAQGGRQRLSEQILTSLGHQLVAWGYYLQQRHGAAREMPALQTADAGR